MWFHVILKRIKSADSNCCTLLYNGNKLYTQTSIILLFSPYAEWKETCIHTHTENRQLIQFQFKFYLFSHSQCFGSHMRYKSVYRFICVRAVCWMSIDIECLPLDGLLWNEWETRREAENSDFIYSINITSDSLRFFLVENKRTKR